jgi:GNAT acetyltransferase-like protein
MVVTASRFVGFRATDVWWPKAAADVEPFLSSTRIVWARQCGPQLAAELVPYAFRRRDSTTALVDLTRTEDELWSALNSTCRHQIRRGRELPLEVNINEDIDAAIALVDAHVRRTGYRRPIAAREWTEALANSDVFSVRLDRGPLAAHVVLRDGARARLLFSATAQRGSPEDRRTIGLASRCLHWHEILCYRDRSFVHYDFGGFVVDPRSPLYAISEFKRSFGGTVVHEESLRLARPGTLRALLRVGSSGRLVARRVVAGVGQAGRAPNASLKH